MERYRKREKERKIERVLECVNMRERENPKRLTIRHSTKALFVALFVAYSSTCTHVVHVVVNSILLKYYTNFPYLHLLTV